MSFINDNFMLKNETAKKLFDYVKDLPIIDYHCHISPKMIAEDYRFTDAYELFLGGDRPSDAHRKRRAQRGGNGDLQRF